MTKSDDVWNFVAKKIAILQSGDSWSRAMQAKLRRGIGKDPRSCPDVWEVTLSDLPERLSRQSGKAVDEPTDAERAIHVALSLYALHQQGLSESVNIKGRYFAEVSRDIVEKYGEKAVKRRFDAVITSSSLEELSIHARGIIQLMKSSNVPGFDYPRFAKDLYRFCYPEGRDSVRFEWGKQFFGYRKHTEEGE